MSCSARVGGSFVGGLSPPPYSARAATIIALLLALLSAPAVARTDTERRPILTVTGAISPPGGGDTASFTREELERLGTVELVTVTPFTKSGEIRFAGVLLRRLLEAVGARGETIHATALNDYGVDIPRSDATRYDVILATRADGKPLPIRDKGPVWVIYPWRVHPELDSPTYNSRSIWQVRTLDIR